MAGVIVLDASVLIAYLDGEDRRHSRTEAEDAHARVASFDDRFGDAADARRLVVIRD